MKTGKTYMAVIDRGLCYTVYHIDSLDDLDKRAKTLMKNGKNGTDWHLYKSEGGKIYRANARGAIMS